MRSCVIFIYQLYGILFLWSTGISLAQEVIEAKNKEKFVIKLGGLFTIYNRGSNESCDMTKPLRYSIEVSDLILHVFLRQRENLCDYCRASNVQICLRATGMLARRISSHLE